MAGRLAGKVALITGAGLGMGRAAAVLFAEEGARVVVADIDADGRRRDGAPVRQAGGRGGGRCRATSAWRTDVRRMVEEGVPRFGALHVLYNNAGRALEGPRSLGAGDGRAAGGTA